MRFWDSSAVVPLVVQQAASSQADPWFAKDPALVLWTFTPVEVVSGLHRLLREGAVKDDDVRAAENRLQEIVAAAHVVVGVEPVKATAVRLLRVHPLRAADALQLAAALCWARNDPRGRELVTWDERLARAAIREGFSVLPAA